jgi:hypothetical protein
MKCEKGTFVSLWYLIKPYHVITYFCSHNNQLNEWNNWNGVFIHGWGVTGVSLLSRHCEWCIFPSLWTCSLFNCYLSVALGPYVQYFSGHEIAFLNSRFRRVSVPQASILGKHLVNEAPLTLGELIVLFYPLSPLLIYMPGYRMTKYQVTVILKPTVSLPELVAQASILHSTLWMSLYPIMNLFCLSKS